jgi:Restriction endonuclease
MPRRSRSKLVGRLKQMQPQEFENLAYDLMFLCGAQNLRWRTPGADGGRDLECEFRVADFSGEHATQKWYVECKRYGKSLDWPTVYDKLTVAINHHADYLLFITTSNFSTPCRDEVQRHNANPGVAQIRIWPFYRLEHFLSIHGQVATKYGLVDEPRSLHLDFQTIIFEITKLAQSTYAAAEFAQRTKDRIELLTAFTELLSTRVVDVKEFGRFVVHKIKPDRDSYEWCQPFPLLASDFDQTSLRAALASIRAPVGLEKLECLTVGDNISVKVPSTNVLRSNRLFGLVATYGLIDVGYGQDTVVLTSRREPDGG